MGCLISFVIERSFCANVLGHNSWIGVTLRVDEDKTRTNKLIKITSIGANAKSV